MSRYIDADKLYKDEISRCGCVPLVGSGENDYKSLKDVLNEAPTDDVVEVVRCKDCRYYDDGECDLHSEPKERRPYERWTVDVRENDYCSYGKKKRRKK